jgi:hypothetical protein
MKKGKKSARETRLTLWHPRADITVNKRQTGLLRNQAVILYSREDEE